MSHYQLPVQIQTMTIRDGSIHIQFPRIAGLNQPQIEEGINQEIVRQVYALIQEQIDPAHPEATEMVGEYEIKTNERGVLSITLSNYAYTYPMAHGRTIIKGLTFDTQTGQLFSLSELFKPNSNYIDTISVLVKEQISKRTDLPVLSEFTEIRADQDFYLADKALVIFFQQLEITPYYVGLPMFPISVYDLESIINEQAPLAKLIAQ